jgi:hypothetical protein
MASNTTVIHFQRESVPAFEHQLTAGQVHAATVHAKAHELHVSLNDGAHMTVHYPPARETALVAALHKEGVPVKIAVLTHHKAAPAHHKLRYIAGGVLIAVILVVLVVLLLGRRRALAEEQDGSAGEGAASQ